jgi:hypothetical protein
MPPLRVVAPLGVGALLAAVAITATATSSQSASAPATHVYRGPVASASGGAVGPLIYPSLVNIRLVRTQAALASATASVDEGKPAGAIPEVKAAQVQMAAAWTGARYVIRTTPPPVAGDGAFAHSSGGAPAGGYASPQDTAYAVLLLQHQVVVTSLGMLGAGNGALDARLTSAIAAAVNARDAAVAYIHSVAPPPVAGAGGVGAKTSGAPVGTDWATPMQQVVLDLDDEVQAIRATKYPGKTLSAATKTFLTSVVTRDLKTEANINTYWPPVVGDD